MFCKSTVLNEYDLPSTGLVTIKAPFPDCIRMKTNNITAVLHVWFILSTDRMYHIFTSCELHSVLFHLYKNTPFFKQNVPKIWNNSRDCIHIMLLPTKICIIDQVVFIIWIFFSMEMRPRRYSIIYNGDFLKCNFLFDLVWLLNFSSWCLIWEKYVIRWYFVTSSFNYFMCR